MYVRTYVRTYARSFDQRLIPEIVPLKGVEQTCDEDRRRLLDAPPREFRSDGGRVSKFAVSSVKQRGRERSGRTFTSGTSGKSPATGVERDWTPGKIDESLRDRDGRLCCVYDSDPIPFQNYTIKREAVNLINGCLPSVTASR